MGKRLLILDASTDRTFYRPTEHWARFLDSVPFDSIDVSGGEPMPSLDRYTHLLLTGSPATFEEPQPWFETEANAVREATEHGLPILGSCFGHQILVWALSGAQYVRRAVTPELGWITIHRIDSDPVFDGLLDPWHAFASHFDEVFDPPPPWRVLASNDVCSVQAIRYGDRPIWGIQPHPEIEPDEALRMMESAVELQPEYGDAIRAAMAMPICDDAVTPQLIDAFLST